MSIDEAVVGRLVQHMVDDAGATLSTALARLGHRLGLYRAMADAGPLTSAEVATSASGWPTKRLAGTCTTTPGATPTSCRPNTP